MPCLGTKYRYESGSGYGYGYSSIRTWMFILCSGHMHSMPLKRGALSAVCHLRICIITCSMKLKLKLKINDDLA